MDHVNRTDAHNTNQHIVIQQKPSSHHNVIPAQAGIHTD